MNKQIPFTDVVNLLLENAAFPTRHLHRFSDIDPANLKILFDVWPQISLSRELALLEDLEELSEKDTLVSFENLAQALLSDLDAGVRTSAIHLLWECLDKKLVPKFLNMLNNDESNETKAAAASALGAFIFEGELEKIPASMLHDIEENLITAVGEGETPLIRQRALEALGTSSREEIPALIETAYHQKDAQWKASAIYAMGRSGETCWEKYILANLHHHQPNIRSEAIRAAGRLSLASARISLFDLLEDEEDPEIHKEIIWSLSEIGGEEVRAKIDEMLDMESDEDEIEFLEEALENYLFTEDLNQFSMLDIEKDDLDYDSDDK